MLSSEYQSHSIKIEDFKVNLINHLNPISTEDGSENYKPITRNVLYYAQFGKFLSSDSKHFI